jgi:hypothetical protein
MNATPAKRYITNNEAPLYLGLGRQTLPKLRLRGTGPVFRKFGRVCPVCGRGPRRMGERSPQALHFRKLGGMTCACTKLRSASRPN